MTTLISKHSYSRMKARKIMIDAYGKFPSDFHVHHIDEDPLNNDFSNLRIMLFKSHMECHRLIRKIKSEPPREPNLEKLLKKLDSALTIYNTDL